MMFKSNCPVATLYHMGPVLTCDADMWADQWQVLVRREINKVFHPSAYCKRTLLTVHLSDLCSLSNAVDLDYDIHLNTRACFSRH